MPPEPRALEQVFGKLTPLGGGYSSRVYATPDRVLKVYKARSGTNRLEAENMRRAGLGEWVVDALEVAPEALPELHLTERAEMLVMKRFPGRAIEPHQVAAALPALGAFLRRLHAIPGEDVDLAALHERLERFDAVLSGLAVRDRLEPLFGLVRAYLQTAPRIPSGLCHLDLWSSNVLFAPPDEVLIVDWHKSGFDDPARDYALFFTGTLELLPLETAWKFIQELSDLEGVTVRLLPYIALTTLHDLAWFAQKQPEGFSEALNLKLPRTLALLR